MPLELNNVEDIFAHNVFLLNAQGNNYDEVRDLINAAGGGGGIVNSVSAPLSISSGNLSINLLNYITSNALSNTLSGYTDTTGLNNILATYTNTAGINTLLSNYTDNTGLTNLLANKQDTLTAGTGITIGNNIISSSVSNLIVQLDGVAQNATTINFLQNNALLSGGVLNVSRLTHYDKIPLIYSTSSTIKDLEQDVNGNLVWNSDILTTATSLNSTLGNYTNTAGINTLLSNYTDTTALTNLLANKQDTLTAGAGITISNNNISSSVSPLIVQLDGVSQNATTLNFLQNNALLSGGVLNVSRLTHYDKIPLIYSTSSTIKDLEQDANGDLLWNSQKMALTSETFTQILPTLPLQGTISGTTITIESLFKPSTITPSGALFGLGSDTLGTLTLGLRFSSPLQYDATANVDTLTCNLLGQPISNITGLQSALDAKVDDSQVLTNVPSGAVFTDTVYSKPASEPISYITGLQAEVNKIANVQVATSGFSLGKTNPFVRSKHRIALYEEFPPSYVAGSHFYGLSIWDNGHGQVGTGIFGGTGTKVPNPGNGTTNIQDPHLLILDTGFTVINGSAAALYVAGNITATGSVSSSDQSIKDNILKADYQEIQNIFNSIDVKTYTRNDGVEGSRIGFIAQDWDSAISSDSKIQNIVHEIQSYKEPEQENPLIGIDYSRIACILWGVCKNQEARIQALEEKIPQQ